MDIFGQAPTQLILFFILYGVTGAVSAIAALYLLLRRSNAFAPDITPPVRLRRWAASFFALSALGHVWWLLFYVYSRNFHSTDDMVHSAVYVAIVVLDCVTLLTTIAGTLFSMLQDCRRPVWPTLVAMIPFVALCGVLMVYPSNQFKQITIAYILSLYVLFTVYMVFAVRRYGRWLNDNYADLENKKVWLSQMVMLGCVLLLILYTLVVDLVLLYFLHFTELVLFCLLLWRVETLPQLDSISTEEACPESAQEMAEATDVTETTQAVPTQAQQRSAFFANINLAQIERLLAEHCVDTQLYLQHDLTLQQLAQAIGTNRFYLSNYFSSQGITYNAYINNLRINHFVSLYREAIASLHTFTAQQLAHESGFRSYSTFGNAFKQRMGKTVTAWMRDNVRAQMKTSV